MPILESIQEFLVTTPPQVLGGYVLLIFGPLPIFGVLIWGFSQVWLDRKQGQYWEKLRWDLLAVSVPADVIQTPKGMENFFNNLMGSKSSITWKEKWFWGKFQAYFCFEIVSNGGNIQFYIRCQKKYRDLVEAALYAQYPEAQITEVEDYIDQVPSYYPDEDYDMWGSEIILKKENFFPIKTYDMFEHVGEKDLRFKDPLLPILEMMGKMRPGEHYWIQILILGPDEQDDWIDPGIKYIKKIYGKPEPPPKKGPLGESVGWIPKEFINESLGAGFGMGGEEEQKQDDFQMFKITPDEREQLDLITKKISKLGWHTKIRFVYVAKKDLFRKGTIASMSKGIFNQFAHLNTNKLGLHNDSTPKDDYFYMEWMMPYKQRRLMDRYKNRSFGPGSTPYILNSEELATLFHFPPAEARTPVLTSVGARRAEAPVELGYAPDEAAVLQNLDRGMPEGVATKPVLPAAPDELATPAPKAPTAVPEDKTLWNEPSEPATPAPSTEPPADQSVQDSTRPAPGRPAPLPPGLDISDEPINPQDTPSDLPV